MTVGDSQSINLEPLHVNYAWPYTQDHAKWASSTDKKKPWVCVGDINRDKSQALARGGGTIAFQHLPLWNSLSLIEYVDLPNRRRRAPAAKPAAAKAERRVWEITRARVPISGRLVGLAVAPAPHRDGRLAVVALSMQLDAVSGTSPWLADQALQL